MSSVLSKQSAAVMYNGEHAHRLLPTIVTLDVTITTPRVRHYRKLLTTSADATKLQPPDHLRGLCFAEGYTQLHAHGGPAAAASRSNKS